MDEIAQGCVPHSHRAAGRKADKDESKGALADRAARPGSVARQWLTVQCIATSSTASPARPSLA